MDRKTICVWKRRMRDNVTQVPSTLAVVRFGYDYRGGGVVKRVGTKVVPNGIITQVPYEVPVADFGGMLAQAVKLTTKEPRNQRG